MSTGCSGAREYTMSKTGPGSHEALLGGVTTGLRATIRSEIASVCVKELAARMTLEILSGEKIRILLELTVDSIAGRGSTNGEFTIGAKTTAQSGNGFAPISRAGLSKKFPNAGNVKLSTTSKWYTPTGNSVVTRSSSWLEEAAHIPVKLVLPT
jgi:hypothetical protein